MDGLPLICTLAGTTHSPGMCPDWESNQRPFGSQASAQSTEPHQPGLFASFNHTSVVDTFKEVAQTCLAKNYFPPGRTDSHVIL